MDRVLGKGGGRRAKGPAGSVPVGMCGGGRAKESAGSVRMCPPEGRPRRGSVGPPAGSVRSPPADVSKTRRCRGRGGSPAPEGWGGGGKKRGGRKGHDKKQSGREGGREGSKHRDVIRVEKGRGGVEGYQKHVEPGPRDGRGQRGVEIDEEQDGPGRWRGARVVAAAGGRHAVAGISATGKTSHSQGRLSREVGRRPGGLRCGCSVARAAPAAAAGRRPPWVEISHVQILFVLESCF